MKNLCLFLAIVLLLFACDQSNQETPEPTDFGFLSMNIVLSIEEVPASGRIEAVSTDDWSVTIFSAIDDSEVINFTPFIDAPAEVQLPTGEYYVEANSNNFQEAAFENPYYFGRSANFTIDKEELKTIDIDAELANSKVAINYSSNVTSTFDDYMGTVTVVSTGTTLPYVQGETREGYFVAEPLSVVVDLSYTKLDGTFITRQFTADIDAQPKTLYNINVDATLEDGEIVINIHVDESFETIEVPLGGGEVITSGNLFLDPNGVTVRANESAVVGDQGTFNGVTYTVVSQQQLRDMVTNGEDVSSVCTSLVTNMVELFLAQSSFNQDISSWDVSNVRNMLYMFSGANSFNQDISAWDVSSTISLSGMFFNADVFNQDIGQWDVSNTNGFAAMFYSADAFNQDIGGWDVSNATSMNAMFAEAVSFNQNLGSWNVSGVTTMNGMFTACLLFDQNISNWDVSSVNDMRGMFIQANSFNQNLSSWDVSNVIFCGSFRSGGNWPLPIFTNCNPS